MIKLNDGLCKRDIIALVIAILFFAGNIQSQIKVELPQISGEVNSEMLGKINIGVVTEYKVVAFQFALYYDKSIIKITGVDVDETLIQGNMPVINADTTNGKIVVAWASAAPIIGHGTLLSLKIKLIKTGLTKLTTTGPDGESFMLNAGAPDSSVIPGEVIVTYVPKKQTEME
ncbi:MAG: hypothetical protein CVV24_06455 [Ignavibacteriae bacterium HGW-Ignavibacteriae-3]|nr:MAG: hypothetical protein CVV24_06455 [Ignavibacteriae bacterium HGW-Ignavibacteriae-3]